LNLVNQDSGYDHYLNDPIDSDDWGTAHLLFMIEEAARGWHRCEYTPPRICVGDLSWGNKDNQEFGGYFSPHVCHQNGLEVDIRYVRNDGAEDPLDISTSDSLFFDEYATGSLINFLIRSADVDLIYIDFNHTTIRREGITYHAKGHSDHFHVRISDPDGTNN